MWRLVRVLVSRSEPSHILGIVPDYFAVVQSFLFFPEGDLLMAEFLHRHAHEFFLGRPVQVVTECRLEEIGQDCGRQHCHSNPSSKSWVGLPTECTSDWLKAQRTNRYRGLSYLGVVRFDVSFGEQFD